MGDGGVCGLIVCNCPRASGASLTLTPDSERSILGCGEFAFFVDIAYLISSAGYRRMYRYTFSRFKHGSECLHRTGTSVRFV